MAMRDRITEVKQKQANGSFTDWIPIGALAQDIEVTVDTSIDESGHTDLQTLLSSGEIGGKVEWIYV